MSSLKKIKSIDQKTKDLIFGYIRESNESISYTTIPMMINYICLLYYHLTDRFTKCGVGMEITSSNSNDSNKNDVVQLHNGNFDDWRNIHGNIIINPRDNPNLIATWVIKMTFDCCIIGIHSGYDGWLCYGAKN